MLSRVADAVYWMARYAERAENVARFLDVTHLLSLDMPGDSSAQWAALVATTGDSAAFRQRFGEPEPATVQRFLTFDVDYPSSIIRCLRAARENARSVREIISSEMYESINRAYLIVEDARRAYEQSPEQDTLHDLYGAVKNASQHFVGVTYLTMTHNEAWHFARLGRLLERADKTSRILDVKYFLLRKDPTLEASVEDEISWVALLKSASAFEMYRKRFGPIVPANVLSFLLLDRKFPRSVRYCVVKAERSLHAITDTPLEANDSLAELRLGDLRAELEGWRIDEIMRQGLHQKIDDFQSKLNSAGAGIFETFFAPQLT